MTHTLKDDLAYAYRILAHLGLDDLTYTHLSARSERGFYIYPFGMLFQQVRAEDLLEVSLDGQVLSGHEAQYNRTGYVIHGAVYKARPDIAAVFHIHTPEIVAVSAHAEGLLPASQWALHFYDKIAFHRYQSLALDLGQGSDIVGDLADRFVMLMENHGSLTCGRTLQEALFYTYHLQMACKTQCLLHGLSRDQLKLPDPATCEKSVKDLLGFEPDLGMRDWQAWRSLKL